MKQFYNGVMWVKILSLPEEMTVPNLGKKFLQPARSWKINRNLFFCQTFKIVLSRGWWNVNGPFLVKSVVFY